MCQIKTDNCPQDNKHPRRDVYFKALAKHLINILHTVTYFYNFKVNLYTGFLYWRWFYLDYFIFQIRTVFHSLMSEKPANLYKQNYIYYLSVNLINHNCQVLLDDKDYSTVHNRVVAFLFISNCRFVENNANDNQIFRVIVQIFYKQSLMNTYRIFQAFI